MGFVSMTSLKEKSNSPPSRVVAIKYTNVCLVLNWLSVHHSREAIIVIPNNNIPQRIAGKKNKADRKNNNKQIAVMIRNFSIGGR